MTFKPNLGKWYLVSFDGELLFHNNCRAICAELTSDTPFTIKEIYEFIECEHPEEDALYEKIKKASDLEEVNEILDATWKRNACGAFAILQPGDMGKLIKIMSKCSDSGWSGH